MLTLMKTIWYGWKRAVHGVNAVISVVLMSFVYWASLVPVAVGFRLFKPDALDRGLGSDDATTFWSKIAGERQDIRRAQRPW